VFTFKYLDSKLQFFYLPLISKRWALRKENKITGIMLPEIRLKSHYGLKIINFH